MSSSTMLGAQSLSLDEVFNVMEFLPLKDLGNALRVCREWNSLDQYEPFWKAILNHFLSSNMVHYFRQCQDLCGSDLKVSNNLNAPQILSMLNSDDSKKKSMVVVALKSMKCINKKTMERMDYQINKSILTMVVNSFDTNVLKDKVAGRISLRMIKQQESKKEEVTNQENDFFGGYASEEDDEKNKEELIGGRFKYLLEKQILSIASTTISTFLSKKDPKRDLFPLFIRTITNKEYQFKDIDNDNQFDDTDPFASDVLHHLVKFHKKSDTLLKYWKDLIYMSINRMPLEVREEDSREIFELLIEKYDNTYSLTTLGHIFDNLDYFECFLPLIKDSIQKNGIESEFLITYLAQLSRLDIPIPKMWERAQIYLDYISDYAPVTTNDNFPNNFIVELSNELEILNEFIDKYPQVLIQDFPYVHLTDFIRDGNAKNFFQAAMSRGVDCSMQIHNLATRTRGEMRYGSIKHTQRVSKLIDFLISEKCLADIYQFEEESKFFIPFMEFLPMVDYELVEKEIEFLFPTIVDLGKIYGQDTEYQERIWNAMGALVSRLLLVEELPQISKMMDRKFTPTVWNVDLLIYVLEDDALYSEVISNIYDLIRYSETESLDEHIHRLLRENPEHDLVNVNFNNFPRSDPKFYICLYNACQLKFKSV